MNNEETLTSKIIALAAYYRETISVDQILMYAEDLQILSSDELSFAIKKYRTNPANKFFPLPAALISLARPEDSDQDIGRLTSAKIVGAISKFGWNNPDKAKEFVGETGWGVIQMLGGWKALCESTNDDNKSTVSAQLRNLCETVNKRKHFDESLMIENKHAIAAINFDIFKKP